MMRWLQLIYNKNEIKNKQITNCILTICYFFNSLNFFNFINSVLYFIFHTVVSKLYKNKKFNFLIHKQYT